MLLMARNVSAQEARVNFFANLNSFCQYNNLGLNGNYTNSVELQEASANVLQGSDNFTIVCNYAGADFQVSPVVTNSAPIGFTNLNNLKSNVTLTQGNNSTSLLATGASPSAIQLLRRGTTNVQAQLVADFEADNQQLSAGSYSYDIIMTITNR